jgi:HAE1 family hydrophobic/amphiphilic exporter-1
MLVDNSIVVLESIFRKRKQGLPLARAAIEGTDEVGGAVAASTLTTVVVFLPIVFVEGIAGQLFKDQALTVTISLLASLMVAITLIPMLSALGRDRGTGANRAAATMTLGRFSRAYDRVVRTALRHRWITVTVAFALLFASVNAIRWLGTELMPPLSEGEFFYEVNLPEGTSLEATNRVMGLMEAEASTQDQIDRHYSTVGSRLLAGGISLNTKAENVGQINIVMKNRKDDLGEAATAQTLRERFDAIPDLDLKFGRPSYFSLKTPVEVILYGENLEDLRSFSLDVAQEMSKVPGLVDVRSSLEAGNPELQVVFNRRRLAAMGLDMAGLSETLKNRVQGVVPTRFKEEDRQIDIRIRNAEGDRSSVNDVRNLVLPGPDGRPIRLSSVADVRLDRGPAEIHRIQQQRAAVVTANLKGAHLGAAVRDIEAAMGSVARPAGITSEIGGQNREMRVSFASLRFALALAIFLVYLVMAATFESFIHPLIVLFTIPLALVGVIVGLVATGTTVSVMVLIGVIMLSGIVVNNAILLIDAINRFRRYGMDKLEAIVQAGHVRLRPILMTTLTTVLGLVPMAVAWGEGSELRSPLAITVVWGLSLATLLTLLVIPAVYMIVPSHVAPEEKPLEEVLV